MNFISAEAVVSAASCAGTAPLTTKDAPRQRLEGRRDAALGVEVVRPGGTAAQRQDRIAHRIGFVAAQAEFAACGGDGGIFCRR